MSESTNLRLKGISQLWGFGGEMHPYTGNEDIHSEPLDNKNLPIKEYYQFISYSRGNIPDKFIIHDLNNNIFECVKCKDVSTPLEPCNNCGNKIDLRWMQNYDYYNSVNKYDNLSCNQCKRTHQQNRWNCKICGCDNSSGNTLFHLVAIEIPKKEGCFVATVCYGDYNSPQVLALRNYRDRKLLTNYSGRQIVKIYYHLSPTVAFLINKSEITKKIIRDIIIDPIIWFIK